jgi:hypothetical protein
VTTAKSHWLLRVLGMLSAHALFYSGDNSVGRQGGRYKLSHCWPTSNCPRRRSLAIAPDINASTMHHTILKLAFIPTTRQTMPVVQH